MDLWLNLSPFPSPYGPLSPGLWNSLSPWPGSSLISNPYYPLLNPVVTVTPDNSWGPPWGFPPMLAPPIWVPSYGWNQPYFGGYQQSYNPYGGYLSSPPINWPSVIWEDELSGYDPTTGHYFII